MFDKKKWYEANKERILAEKHEDYIKNKQKYLDRCHDQYSKNKIKILEQHKLKDMEFKKKLGELLGLKCVICGSTHRISYHEIHGNPHKPRKYVLEHYQDFIPLCSGCHVGLHRFIRRGKINVKILVELIDMVQGT